MREHRRAFGRGFVITILETGDSIEWRDAEHRWIAKMRAAGVALLNKTAGRNGVESLSKEAREKLSRWGRGRKKPDGHGAKVSAAQKGVPKTLTPEGRERLRDAGRRSGHRWKCLSAEGRAAHSARSREQWAALSPEERVRRLRDLQATAWAGVTGEARSARGKKAAVTRTTGAAGEKFSAAQSASLKQFYNEHRDIAQRRGDRIREWWASLSATDREAYIARRTVAIMAAKAAKRRPPELAF